MSWNTRIAMFAAVALLGTGCGDPSVEGTGGTGAVGGSGEPSNSDYVDDFGSINDFDEADLEGFTVAPPPHGDEFKDKVPFDEKLRQLLETTEVPSALAGAFIQQARGYLSGRAPENELEASAFAVFDGTSPEVLEAIARTIDGVDALREAERAKLYGARFVEASADEALSIESLAASVANEFGMRLSRAAFGEEDPAECLDSERPGLARETPRPVDGDEGHTGFYPRICTLKTDALVRPIRTAQYSPVLLPFEYRPSETELRCTIDPVSGEDDCPLAEPPNCMGAEGSGPTCLAVPVVRPGDTVVIYGTNFFDTEMTVKLTARGVPFEFVRVVPSHICGDVETPIDAPEDCSIQDRASFVIPTDLPPALYDVVVGVSDDSEEYFSQFSNAPVLQVLPPSNAGYQLTSEELLAIDESRRTDVGSDEIGLKIITIPVAQDGTMGEMQSVGFEFEDVDTGERRDLNRVHFSDPVEKGFSLAVVGFEIDNQEAYEKNVRDFADAYALIVESNWNKIAETLGEATSAGVKAAGYGEYSEIAGQVVKEGFKLGLAAWAPADLVIEDSEGISMNQLAEMTSLGFATPPRRQRVTSGGINVLVAPCENGERACPEVAKAANQYRERREYWGGAKATYQVRFRYNRTEPLRPAGLFGQPELEDRPVLGIR